MTKESWSEIIPGGKAIGKRRRLKMQAAAGAERIGEIAEPGAVAKLLRDAFQKIVQGLFGGTLDAGFLGGQSPWPDSS